MALSKFLDPKNDIAFRRIFGSERNKDILIHFINDILGFKGNDEIQEVTFLSTIQDPEIASKKQSVVDVLCKDANGVKIIVEMQVAPQKGFIKRAQYYASKTYFSQLNRGKKADGQYSNLKEVIFIAISDYVIFPKKEAYKSDHIMLDKNTHEHDLKDFSFTFIELPKFKKKKVGELKNIVEKWCHFFKNADKTKETDLEKLIGEDIVIKKAYDELNQYNWTEQELFTYEQEIKRVWDNRAAQEYALEVAEKKGMEKGIEKGIEKGARTAIKETAIKMIKAKSDVKFISTVTGLSEDEILQLKNKI